MFYGSKVLQQDSTANYNQLCESSDPNSHGVTALSHPVYEKVVTAGKQLSVKVGQQQQALLLLAF